MHCSCPPTCYSADRTSPCWAAPEHSKSFSPPSTVLAASSSQRCIWRSEYQGGDGSSERLSALAKCTAAWALPLLSTFSNSGIHLVQSTMEIPAMGIWTLHAFNLTHYSNRISCPLSRTRAAGVEVSGFGVTCFHCVSPQFKHLGGLLCMAAMSGQLWTATVRETA